MTFVTLRWTGGLFRASAQLRPPIGKSSRMDGWMDGWHTLYIDIKRKAWCLLLRTFLLFWSKKKTKKKNTVGKKHPQGAFQPFLRVVFSEHCPFSVFQWNQVSLFSISRVVSSVGFSWEEAFAEAIHAGAEMVANRAPCAAACVANIWPFHLHFRSKSARIQTVWTLFGMIWESRCVSVSRGARRCQPPSEISVPISVRPHGRVKRRAQRRMMWEICDEIWLFFTRNLWKYQKTAHVGVRGSRANNT